MKNEKEEYLIGGGRVLLDCAPMQTKPPQNRRWHHTGLPRPVMLKMQTIRIFAEHRVEEWPRQHMRWSKNKLYHQGKRKHLLFRKRHGAGNVKAKVTRGPQIVHIFHC
jgi:hypothetical protein